MDGMKELQHIREWSASLHPKGRRSPNGTDKRTLTIGCRTFFYHCLYLQCHDALELQHVGLVTFTEGLYHCILCIGGKCGGRGGREVDEGIPIPANTYHGK